MSETILIYRQDLTRLRMRRIVDVVIAALALATALPIIFVACLAILIEDGMPVLHRQIRVGRFERLFTIYKLRTMRAALCTDGPSPQSPADDRITTVGRFLRKTSIDELPQLFNVIRGDMAIVGPRPEMAIMIARYEAWQHLRHLVRPGITCIWQTTCRSTVSLDRPEATALDLEYIRRSSPFLDGALLLKTLGAIVSRKGAF